MLRTFQTHYIRKQRELSGKSWEFMPLEGEHAGERIQVAVPSCWETYPGFENYRGKARYRTCFEAEGNVRLIWKGISHFGRVYVDGRLEGSHYGSYTAFDMMLKRLAPGVHILEVEVDNAYRPEYSLDKDNDYMSYGGISRGVALEEVGEVFLTWIHITPLFREGSGWHAMIEVEAENLSEGERSGELEIFIQETSVKSGKISIPVGKSVIYREKIFFDGVEDWSLERPALYQLQAVLTGEGIAEDDLVERTGFRTVSVEKNRICLNGKPLRIKGFCRHEDHPQYGCSLPLEAMDYDLRLIRDMGGNSVRTAHYPNDERFLDLCDEYGILVWEENHARGLSEEIMRSPYFEEQAETVIREMIGAHYNHPCIYIWGILNECASETEYGRKCYVKQLDLIRSLDRSRPCSFASCRYEQDLCMDLPDVTAWNMYPYWYENKTARDMVDELFGWTRNEGGGAGKPFLVTEIGAGAIYGFRSSDMDKWTEEYQAWALEHQLAEIFAYSACSGLYIWQFCDNRVGKGYFEKRPRTRNNKGIVDEFRRRKLAYESVKKIFSQISDYFI